MKKQQIVIIGGGAAGFFTAVNAARINLQAEIILLEKSNKLLSKVRVSGGGRCNVTHACFDNAELVKNYPRGGKELRQAFSRFSVNDTIRWFEERGVELHTENDGRMFPVTNNSQTIIDCLLHEAEQYKVRIRTGCEVTGIEKVNNKFNLLVSLSGDEGGEHTLTADNILVACGGHPKSAAYDFIRKTGHTIVEPVPSLFTFNMPGNKITQLMGLSSEPVLVRIPGTKEGQEGALLITHWGMSGPAVLKTSAWAARTLYDTGYKFDARLSWLPKMKEEELRDFLSGLREQEGPKQVASFSPFHLPRRLWEFLLQKSGIERTILTR
ncbi:MAG: hypothetical protein FD123_2775 [Bacteroidetes bacterium]|nr:MAG: hypothetical protein FD123_2775 [Bacteroidota bacterium]